MCVTRILNKIDFLEKETTLSKLSAYRGTQNNNNILLLIKIIFLKSVFIWHDSEVNRNDIQYLCCEQS